jgi:hypothetical protein
LALLVALSTAVAFAATDTNPLELFGFGDYGLVAAVSAEDENGDAKNTLAREKDGVTEISEDGGATWNALPEGQTSYVTGDGSEINFAAQGEDLTPPDVSLKGAETKGTIATRSTEDGGLQYSTDGKHWYDAPEGETVLEDGTKIVVGSDGSISASSSASGR